MIRPNRVARPAGLLAALALVALTGASPTSESWDAVYLGGAKAGHIHTYIEPVKDKGRDLLRVRIDMVVSYKRLKDRVTMKLHYGTIETLDGSVLRLDTRI